MAKTRNLAEVIRRKLAKDPDLAAAVEAERFKANVASEIVEARLQAGLTQEQLASRIGTHQPVIARLEDAEYEGHSLKMLERIASALGKRVEIRFVDQCTASPTVNLEPVTDGGSLIKKRSAKKRRMRA